jgi:uncharacterized protein
VIRLVAEASLRDALTRAPAVALLGPRQVGKTTLAKRLAAGREDVLYLDAERRADARKLDDADAFLRQQAGKLVIIDEVHHVPHLFRELRGIIDDRRAAGLTTGQFLLLGSASLDLVQHASESLAGRVVYMSLDPIDSREGSAAGHSNESLWLRGGFPESLLAKNDAASLQWRVDFIRSYLERDVPMFAPRMPATTLSRFWTMLAHSQGTMLNHARLAQGLGVTGAAVGRYVDLLADLLLVRRLQPWSGNGSKRLVKSPKVYVRDSGLVHALLDIGTHDALLGHPVAGPSWEGFVIENLLAVAGPRTVPMFYRSADGAEIDLLLEVAGRVVVAIEVKRSSSPHIDKPMTTTCDALDISQRWVIGNVEDSYPARDGVTVHSLSTAMTALHGLVTAR